MWYSLLADTVLVLHLCFVLFVIFGGFLVLRHPRAALIHLPCAMWGVLIEFSGWLCPLTPLEIRLRQSAGLAGYRGGFIEHYVFSILYPAGLTRGHQIAIGIFVLVLNVWLYRRVLRRRSTAAAVQSSVG